MEFTKELSQKAKAADAVIAATLENGHKAGCPDIDCLGPNGWRCIYCPIYNGNPKNLGARTTK